MLLVLYSLALSARENKDTATENLKVGKPYSADT